MKKSRFYIGNIVKKSYKTYKPITFLLGDSSNKVEIEEQIVKENALLYRINGKYVDVEKIKNNFDLFCEYIMRRHMGMEYFDMLDTFSYELEIPYVDKRSLTRYYSEQHYGEGTSLGKVKRLAMKDPKINIIERSKKK